MLGQFVDELVNVAVHHGVQLVDRQVDAMIGHPVLGEVIGANLFAAVTGTHLALARGVDLVALVGYYTMIALTLNTFQIPSPDGKSPFV